MVALGQQGMRLPLERWTYGKFQTLRTILNRQGCFEGEIGCSAGVPCFRYLVG